MSELLQVLDRWMPLANSKPHSLRQLCYPQLGRAFWSLSHDTSIKMDWHLLYGIRYLVQKLTNYGQEKISTGLLTSALWGRSPHVLDVGPLFGNLVYNDSRFVCKFDIRENNFFCWFWLFHILMPYNIILYFRLPYFHVSDSAFFLQCSSSVLSCYIDVVLTLSTGTSAHYLGES